ncbi:MAG: hypothetical protein C0606_10285 [Hyphomicrobiales bacterium]|nr:MAG: hypothetical protein C0606_10285 [Hyphomicrobiales bacterium]
MIQISKRFLRALAEGLSPLGVVASAVVFNASLTPTLVPRDALISGLLGGVFAALGYELGNLFSLLWRYLELPVSSVRNRRIALVLAGAIAAAVVAYGLFKAIGWQNATRTVFRVEPLHPTALVTILLAAIAVAFFLWLLFRVLGMARHKLQGWLERIVPRRIGYVVSTVVVLWLVWVIASGTLLQRVFDIADRSLAAADALFEPDIARPDDPVKTGSAASLIRWNELGRRGRQYIARAPTAAEIAPFFGAAARDPVRVYVGRGAAETAKARAKLALEELIRVGGFERSVLVVTVPTGTGWMDPGAYDTVDVMFGGDVATVSVQYSYLSSFLALMKHPEYGVDQAEALFDVVYAHWKTLPRETRPKFYVSGLSQGAYNSQAALPLLDMLGDPINGAMWAGSPFFSHYWADVRDDRNPDSPAWRPTFGNGSLARVLTQTGGLDEAAAPWGPVRFVFLNYPSDPIVAFTFDSAFRQPAWLERPRAPDVSDELIWFPMLTMLQTAVDSVLAVGVPGYGHDYVAADYIDAWAAVADPPGWSPARAEALKAYFRARR